MGMDPDHHQYLELIATARQLCRAAGIPFRQAAAGAMRDLCHTLIARQRRRGRPCRACFWYGHTCKPDYNRRGDETDCVSSPDAFLPADYTDADLPGPHTSGDEGDSPQSAIPGSTELAEANPQ